MVAQNITLLKIVLSYKMFIFQISSAFILILFSHYFTVVMCVLNWEINTPYISKVSDFKLSAELSHIDTCICQESCLYLHTEEYILGTKNIG